jgi:steroid delta-isomerase-like uncharacterized protein
MSVEQNKTIIRRTFEEVINQNKSQVITELIATTYVNHNMPTPVPGPDGFKMVVGMFRTAFPDLHITLEDVLGEGDKVATRGYFTGTHKGDFNGIPATGKKVKVSYSDLWRVQNGKATENWVQIDMMGLMQQLGVIPTPEGA